MTAGRRLTKITCGVAVLAALAIAPTPTARADLIAPTCTAQGAPGGKLADIRTVVPQQLNMVNEHQREMLRFSNLIANTGAGPWRLRPEFPLVDTNNQQTAIQQVLDSEDSSGTVVCEKPVSSFQYHPSHRHWHTDGIAEFSVRSIDPLTGPAFHNLSGIKTTFCLIDWVKLTGSSNSGKNTTRVYFDCFGAFHGVSVGWADQYHHATDGQALDVTGLVAGTEYFLVSVTNADKRFVESDYTNNTAWQGFKVSRDSKGNPKLVLTENHSPCVPGTGLCGEQTANR